MDFTPSARSEELCARLWDFMHGEVFAAESAYRGYIEEFGRHVHPPVMDKLQRSARSRGLWNLFLGGESGLTNVEYAAVAEISGWSPTIAPEAMNCQAPDSGNMELLHLFATPQQKRRWREPLLDGRIRSAFAMTEPGVASSDATNISTRIRRDGDSYVIDGRKWWTSGAMDERCAVFIVVGQTDPAAEAHRRASMILVPRAADGVTIERDLPLFGYHDQHGHAEVVFEGVRVPEANLIGGEGDGFAIAQARLGPGRVHHAMRAVGMAERALALMVDRAKSRRAFGGPLVEQGVVRELIAQSRIEIDQVRLYVQKTAWLIDRHGAKAARAEISGIKVAAPAMAIAVIDRAIEVFGAEGICDDTPLAYFYAWARALRIVDGPDAVHRRAVALHELRRSSASGAPIATRPPEVPSPSDAASSP